MPIEGLFKLEKLTIGVYTKRDRSGIAASTFEVTFNPESFSMRHENVYRGWQGINTSTKPAVYSHSRPQELSLTLVFDGTGVDDYGLAGAVGLGSPSVSRRVDDFLSLCFRMEGEIHEPKFLRLSWGDGPLTNFDCRLKSANVAYTSFDRRGAPLRATLTAAFVEDLDTNKSNRLVAKSSPDLTHARVVKGGDTLPLLCDEVYGSPVHYLYVARYNRLDDFRNLEPGRELLFPPLPKRAASDRRPR